MSARGTRGSGLLTCLLPLCVATASFSALADFQVIQAEDIGDWQRMAQTGSEEILMIQGLELAEGHFVDLAIREVDPFASDARLHIDTAIRGPLGSQRKYYRGQILGKPGSRVTMSVGPDGGPRGLLASNDGHWVLHTPAADGMRARFEGSEKRAGADDLHDDFVCEAERFEEPASLSRESESTIPSHPLAVTDNNERYRVRVAFESTWQFRELFDSDQQAIDYLGDIINYTSGIYINDLGAELVISSINLWSSEQEEPWTRQGDAWGLLHEFTDYWRDLDNDVDRSRTIAHMVDAGDSRNGRAWIGVVCSGGYDEMFDWDNSSDFAVSAGLETDFHAIDAPSAWSAYVVAHEIGHNFDTDHTHCYDPPVDTCFNLEGGCYDGETSLPGEPGEGSGTIMSYCSARLGGLENIAPSLGRDHPYGHEPDRVPDTMRAHMVERAQEGGRCPQVISSLSHRIFSSLSGSGSITPTSAQVDHGDTVEFTVLPDRGQVIESAQGCGGELVGNTFTTAPVTTDCNLSIEFAEDENIVLWDRFES